jgi:1-deoxy-D-xylulose-5-phosphate reductoisomerase
MSEITLLDPAADERTRPEPRRVTVLGATGSIGRSTADLLAAEPARYRVEAVVGGSKAGPLAETARRLRARAAVLADPAGHAELASLLAGSGIEAAAGAAAVLEAASRPVDWTMAAITGIAGLAPTLAAIRNGAAVALANKEALVSAGDVMLRAVADAGAVLLPCDSEHNAIFQALGGRVGGVRAVEKIVLTASGGPFRCASLPEMEAAGPEQALRHPTWSMGAKITVDSATMFNKGLEVIEAARLFALGEDRIDVLVHPQSIVHGLVHFTDGSVLAQLGAPDMRIPIAHCLAWPARLATTSPRHDLATIATLEFAAPDPARFPALRLAREALRAGGGAPAILNAANEVAVAAFLDRRLGFCAIARLVERVMERLGAPRADTLDEVVAIDAEARALAGGMLA